MASREVREIWANRDKGRHYYAVDQEGTEDMAADEHEAVVAVENNSAHCYRCDRKADIEFKCVHIHAVRRTLDI